MRNNEINPDDHTAHLGGMIKTGKALGYSQYQQFKPAIERAVTQMKNSNDKPEDHLSLQTEMIKTGKGAAREVPRL